VEIKAVLSDGSSAIFKEITSAEFIEKRKGTRSKVRSTRPFMRNFRILKTKRRLSRNFRNQKYTDEIQAMQ
jgi:hypothetical protein